MTLADLADLTVTRARINLDALRHNTRLLRARARPSQLMAVVKANAYGHGAERVAQTLADEGIDAFAVATVPEGIALRKAGVEGTILVFSTPQPAFLPAYEQYALDVAITSLEVARQVAASRHALRVHLKVDTGMHRAGVMPGEVAEAVAMLKTPHLSLAALWTHFATADDREDTFASAQAAVLLSLRPLAPDVPVHVANSGALLTGHGILKEASVARIGLALYGLTERDAGATVGVSLQEVMQFVSQVVTTRVVPSGETVSYGRTWQADRDTHVATVGAGYADGVPRALSNQGVVGIRAQRLPIIGRVCMDALMVNAGPATAPGLAQVGDEVVLFGPGGPSAHEVAGWLGTIAYEIACGVSARVPRVYV